MRFLPIVERELRVASRRWGTYWTRIAAALVALVIGTWILTLSGIGSTKVMGTAMFAGLGIFAMTYSILAGLRTTSDCLSEEKREGTLGLLFLTDLKGYDIVFGKLFATSLNAAYGLLAIIPVLAIPLMLGGVTIAEFVRVMLSCLNCLYFSLAMGMFCSAISKDDRKSLVATFSLLLFFAGGLPLIGGLLTEMLDLPRPVPMFFIVSPGYLSFAAYDETFNMLNREKFNYFYTSFITIHLMSWGLIGLACYIVPRTWKDAVATPEQARRQEKLDRWKHGDPHTRAQARARLLDVNPIYWLTSRDRLKTLLVWGALGMGAFLWIWGLIDNPHNWNHEGAYITTAFLAHTLLKCWIALEASRRFGLDRKSGALELILSTPITIRQLVLGQLSGLSKQFSGPALFVLAFDLVFLVTKAHDAEWVTLWTAGMAIFVLDLLVISLVSMWKGFALGNPGRGSGVAVLLVMTAPWVTFVGLLTLFALLSYYGPALGGRNAFIVLLALWTAISVGFDIALGTWAWRNLNTKFRTLSSQQTKGKRLALNRDSSSKVSARTAPPMPAG